MRWLTVVIPCERPHRRREVIEMRKKPTKAALSAAGKALQNPRTREVNERKAAQILRKGRGK